MGNTGEVAADEELNHLVDAAEGPQFKTMYSVSNEPNSQEMNARTFENLKLSRSQLEQRSIVNLANEKSVTQPSVGVIVESINHGASVANIEGVPNQTMSQLNL